MNKIVALLVLIAALPAAAQVTTVAGSVDMREQASAPAVRANYGRVYMLTDGKLYLRKDSGAIVDLTNASAMSAAEILAELVTVDGAGSLLDADTLDGVSGDGYCLLDGSGIHTGSIILEGATADDHELTLAAADPSADVTLTLPATAGTIALLADIPYDTAAELLAALVTVDGTGSGLDADLLDGASSAAFALVAGGNAFATSNTYEANDITDADVVDTITASNYTLLTDYEDADVLAKLLNVDGPASGLNADLLDGSSSAAFAVVAGGNAFAASNTYAANDITDADVVDTITASNYALLTDYEDADVLAKLLNVDGTGSGLNADLLDGSSSAAFAVVAGGNTFATSNSYAANDITDADVVDTITASNYALLTDYEDADVLAKLLNVDGTGSGLNADLLDGTSIAGLVAVGDYDDGDVLNKVKNVDGAASGLDADLLDGISSLGFCHADGSVVMTGGLTFEGATANEHETTFAITDPTDDRTITFKDESGTVAFLADVAGAEMEAADILAALITVDGAGSGLDADLLDGSSSAAFAVVAGGNTFAASNSYTANDITDADVVDTITASNYTLLTDYEDADVLAKLLNVDGPASGLNADLLDGSSSAAFAVVAGGNAFASSNTYAANDITDADVSDTLTASSLVGTGSTSAAVDLNTAETDGVLPESKGGTGASTLAAATIDADTLDGIDGADVVVDTDYEAADVLAKLVTVDGSGSGLDADTVDGINVISTQWTTVTKTTTDALQNDATVNDDDELLFAMAASTSYRIRIGLLVDIGATPDFKFSVEGPASPTSVLCVHTSGSGRAAWDDYTDEASISNTGATAVPLDCVIENGANAGNFVVQWSQNTSNAASTSMLKGSYLEYDEL